MYMMVMLHFSKLIVIDIVIISSDIFVAAMNVTIIIMNDILTWNKFAGTCMCVCVHVWVCYRADARQYCTSCALKTVRDNKS